MSGARAAARAVVSGWSMVPDPALLWQCGHNACKIMLAASEMVSPLVSEGQYTASNGFGGGQWSLPAAFLQGAYTMLGPRFCKWLWFWKR